MKKTNFAVQMGLGLALIAGMNNMSHATDKLEARGQGKSPCSDFIQLVDGDWSHPLNALNFHGFNSWAQGLVTGYNTYSGKEPIMISMEDLKMSLVNYCRANPDEKFADAVNLIITQ